MPVKDKGTVYSVPDTFFLRLHHCRPRFKNDVESVLIAIATVIGDMQEAPIEPFMDNLFLTIKNYPGNFNKTDKTIHNWKTEISTLFGLVEYHSPREGWCRPGATAKMLAENQDIPQFFKTFLFTFQYPGAHIKKQEIKNLIEAEVKFKPAKYIIEVLKTGEEQYSQFSITKAEATHCVFNDLRVTRDGRDAGETARLIQNNRSERFSYDETGDVIRYAGDILDYMVLANLLRIDPSGKYFSLNWAEIHAIDTFLSSSKWFGGYDHLYGQEMIGYGEIDEIFASWFHYVNDLSYNRNFSTNLSSFMSLEGREGREETEGANLIKAFLDRIASGSVVSTLEIGNLGQNIVLAHETRRLKNEGREDLVHLVKQLPNNLAVGYDIQSFEPEGGSRRLIEVKTTISKERTTVSRFKMTDNEFNAANQFQETYFVYRLEITAQGPRLFLVKNPVGHFKSDKACLELRNGAFFTFAQTELKEETLLI